MKNKLLKWFTGYGAHPISDNKDVLSDFRKFNKMLNCDLINYVERINPIPQTGLELVLKDRLKSQIEYALEMERDSIHAIITLNKANERIDQMHCADSDLLELRKWAVKADETLSFLFKQLSNGDRHYIDKSLTIALKVLLQEYPNSVKIEEQID